jgi:hypothetical protein
LTKYTKEDDKTCITNTACDGFPTFFKDVSELNCVNTCLAGQYKDNTDRECKTKAECDTDTKYTLDADMTCITGATCIGTAGQFKDVSELNCVTTCVAGHFKDNDDKECKSKAECDTDTKYTKAADATCVTATTCTSVAGFFKDVSGLNCVTACPPGEFKDPDDRDCKTKAECTSASKYTKADTNECLTSAQCIGNPGFLTHDTTNDCVNTCPATYYKEPTLKKCLTKGQCTALAPSQYTTGGATPECITATACTGGGDLKKTDTFDCVNTCPLAYLKHDATDECIDKPACVGLGKFSHNVTEPECIDGLTCVSNGKFKNLGWNDCDANCPLSEDYKYKETSTNECKTKI